MSSKIKVSPTRKKNSPRALQNLNLARRGHQITFYEKSAKSNAMAIHTTSFPK